MRLSTVLANCRWPQHIGASTYAPDRPKPRASAPFEATTLPERPSRFFVRVHVPPNSMHPSALTSAASSASQAQPRRGRTRDGVFPLRVQRNLSSWSPRSLARRGNGGLNVEDSAAVELTSIGRPPIPCTRPRSVHRHCAQTLSNPSKHTVAMWRIGVGPVQVPAVKVADWWRTGPSMNRQGGGPVSDRSKCNPSLWWTGVGRVGAIWVIVTLPSRNGRRALRHVDGPRLRPLKGCSARFRSAPTTGGA